MKSLIFRNMILILFAMSLAGCSSFGKKLKAFLGGKSSQPTQQAAAATQKSRRPSFAQTGNYQAGPRRQYKRVTKESLAEEAKLKADSGSLWVMEGQGAYLFSENIVRMIGDPVSIKIEGESREQLESKTTVIKDLLSKLEARAQARRKAQLRGPAGAEDGGNTEGAQSNKPTNTAPKTNTAGKDKENFKVRTVTGRVIERTVDGNYRIKGSQPFMIGSREYKVLVTGIVRAEDFNESGVSSNKLLDPSFDIVGVRKKEI